MGMGNSEIELKFAGPPAIVSALPSSKRMRRLIAWPGDWRRLETTYYDTPERELARQGVSLRLRTIGRERVQTVKRKITGAAIIRGEYETTLKNSGEFPAPTGNDDLDRIIMGCRESILPVVRMQVDRWTARAVYKKAEIEIAVDLGRADFSKRRAKTIAATPVSELELELLSGKRRALFALAREFAVVRGLAPVTQSKLERARAATRPIKKILRARPTIISDPKATPEDILRTALAGNAERIAQLAPMIINQREGGAIHQMRVALRRLPPTSSRAAAMASRSRSSIVMPGR